MSREIKLIVYDADGNEIKGEPHLTRDQYNAFCDRFYSAVKPALDEQARARAKSWDSARDHFIR